MLKERKGGTMKSPSKTASSDCWESMEPIENEQELWRERNREKQKFRKNRNKKLQMKRRDFNIGGRRNEFIKRGNR
jgi:hypothetical protein